MKRLTFIFLATISLFCSFRPELTIDENGYYQSSDSLLRDTLLRFDADPAAGYNFPFYIFIPKGTKTGKQFLLVEPNNNGNNDTLAYHERTSRQAAKRSSMGNGIARKLKVPYLVPVFPRPMTDWKIYSHALDRDVMLIKKGEMKRLDLQLIAMMNAARVKLGKMSFDINQKFLLNGFSASGTFINRFTMLHPEMVAACAAGGFNAILIVPSKKEKNEKLNYPIGINDVKKITGTEVDLEKVKKVPQFYYMGALDDNDAALFDDGYSKSEQQQIFKILGRSMHPDRWNVSKSYYEKAGFNVQFKTYEGIGHATDGKINGEVADFFRKIMTEYQ